MLIQTVMPRFIVEFALANKNFNLLKILHHIVYIKEINMGIENKKEIKEILERARTAIKSAKMYEETTDFEAAKFMAKSAYEYYRQLQDTCFMKEKADCEMYVAKLAHICADLEGAVKYSFLASKSYENIFKQDASQYLNFVRAKLWCAKLYERLEMQNNAIESYSDVIDVIVENSNAKNKEEVEMVEDCLDGLWRIKVIFGCGNSLAVRTGKAFLENAKDYGSTK